MTIVRLRVAMWRCIVCGKLSAYKDELCLPAPEIDR